MSAERYIVSGYGLCKISIDGEDYIFDVIDKKKKPIESMTMVQNIFGNYKKKIKGYYIEWELLLGCLIPNTAVTPNITKNRANIYNFIKKYYELDDETKVLSLIPSYGIEPSFSATNNCTLFNVLTKEAPEVIPHKASNVKLGQVLSLQVVTQNRLSVSEYKQFYRNTLNDEWYGVGVIVGAMMRDDSSDIQLEFRDNGVNVNAEFKTGE